MADAVAELERRLGYAFDDRRLLELALSHRSYVAEHPGTASYERLEFLGDAVLQLAVTRYLYDTRPEATEGQMAKVRAAVVSEPTLAELATRLGIPEAVRLGRGEEMTGGREKPSILSDVVEAIFGAVFLDAGYDRAAELVVGHLAPVVDERATAPGGRDYKTRLQELLVARGIEPRYEVEVSGPEHARRFRSVVYAGEEPIGEGEGTSKKRAQQAAAADAFARMGDRGRA